MCNERENLQVLQRNRRRKPKRERESIEFDERERERERARRRNSQQQRRSPLKSASVSLSFLCHHPVSCFLSPLTNFMPKTMPFLVFFFLLFLNILLNYYEIKNVKKNVNSF